ncbi:MAG: TonB-dependent receptor [Gammaproteobacteria bacterium]|nr:TonB-dependent receptor [Gammaproteobacteria bacterium]
MHRRLPTFVRNTLLGAAIAALSQAAVAQQSASPNGPSPDPSDATQAPLQEIIVTGSRIAAPNEQSTSPILVLSSKDIETSGKTDISDLIAQLPQIFTNDLGQDLGNGTSGLTTAGGVATADLRGLGPNRTLVLVDGRRLGQGSPYTFIQSPAPDLDQIPAGLVQRVEVVTGGASAAYGSDAIAGVVNFILKKNFQGLQVDGQYNENYHDNGNGWVQNLVRQFGTTPPTGVTQDGRKRSFDILMGTNFADNKGNVTAYLSYRHQDPVLSEQRDFGSCILFPTFDNNGNVTGVTCGGSSYSNKFIPAPGEPGYGTTYSVYGNQFVPRGSVATTPPATYNPQQLIYMTRDDSRYNAAIMAHEALTESVQPYAQFFFMDDRTNQQIAPDALFGDNQLDPQGAGYFYTNCSNPLLSAQEASLLCTPAQISADAAAPGSVTVPLGIGRRMIEGGPRTSLFEHQNYRIVLGTKGNLGDAWNYDVYGQYYYTTFFNRQDKYLNFQSIANSLLVTGTASNPTCINRGVGAQCVPFNIWQQGGVNQAQLNYLFAIGTGQGTSTLRTEHAEITGHLGKYGITSPFAHEGVGVNVGMEHRNDHEQFTPDALEQSGLLEGFGSAAVAIDNTVSVTDTFAEIRAPLVQDKTGVKSLLFDTGYRHSHYSTAAGGVGTYKFEVQYAPIEDYRFRFSFDKAIRAPSVVELFNPQLVGLIAGSDPCAPTFDNNGAITAPAAMSLQQCERTGVTAAQYGNGGSTNTVPQGVANQINQLSGGNPNLQPEQGDTYTVGLNFAPHQIRNLTGSIDYYHIKITNEVGTVPVSLAFSQCAATGDPTYCNLIVRNHTTGGINEGSITAGGYVVQTNVNIASALQSGIDLQLNYLHALPADLGSLAFSMNGSWLQQSVSTPLPGGGSYDCAGLFGYTCQTINPRWHHIFRTTWLTPWHVSASVTWRYISSVAEDNNQPNPLLHFATYGGYDYFNATIPSYSYVDLALSWQATKWLQLRAGANNIMDKDPPIINAYPVAGGAANTYSTYDMFGRQLFAAFSAKF